MQQILNEIITWIENAKVKLSAIENASEKDPVFTAERDAIVAALSSRAAALNAPQA